MSSMTAFSICTKPLSIEVLKFSSSSNSLTAKLSIANLKNGAFGGNNDNNNLDASLFTPLAPIP